MYLFSKNTCYLYVYICTAEFFWQKYHSRMNVTERILERTFHCKSAPNGLTKFLVIVCSKAVKVTRLHKCHWRITVLGKGWLPQRLQQEWQFAITLLMRKEFAKLPIKKDIASLEIEHVVWIWNEALQAPSTTTETTVARSCWSSFASLHHKCTLKISHRANSCFKWLHFES